MNLKQTFIKILSQYSENVQIIKTLWQEIEDHYREPHRYYHNLNHIKVLYYTLQETRDIIQDWDSILLTMYYHDVIYDVSKNDNEEKSASLAEKRLHSISFPEKKISNCKSQILATKAHLQSNDPDTNLFTDADLSILGQDWNIYSKYYKNIRMEYSIYTDEEYYKGRKKVLNYFLSLEKIYKTNFFMKNLKTMREKIYP
ncbi:HD domain-containing protein [Leptospira noguchii]|uniref:HD domain-containing protein n=1 Tax=Leptospira noguchii TaxID=28182 RepID=UPI0003286CF6|nr:hypothetical protein [Leptospira noguchii]EMS87125.1 hypothetical protein LEP1GSC073_0435 [Leptospira noguchii str. Cascata]